MSAAESRAEPTRLVVTRSVTSDRAVCLTVAGEVDIGTVDLLREALAAAVEESAVDRVVLDFGPLAFLDSSGIAALIASHRLAEKRGIGMAIINCHGTVRHVLEVTGILALLSGA
jgi:anti-sigma B factor antagonist